MNTEILKKILNHFIMACELDEILRQKHLAVREQSFELAVKWREEENKLRSQLITLDELKALREELNQQNQTK